MNSSFTKALLASNVSNIIQQHELQEEELDDNDSDDDLLLESLSSQHKAKKIWYILNDIDKKEHIKRRTIMNNVITSNDHIMFLEVEFPSFPYPVIYHQGYTAAPLAKLLPWHLHHRCYILHDPISLKVIPLK